jgi:hypothetical protein
MEFAGYGDSLDELPIGITDRLFRHWSLQNKWKEPFAEFQVDSWRGLGFSRVVSIVFRWSPTLQLCR